MSRNQKYAMISLIPLAGILLVSIGTDARRDDEGRQPGIQVSAEPPRPNDDGVVVRVSLVGEAGQRERLKQTWGFEKYSVLLTPRVLHNPLWADALEVSIENTSEKDLEILCPDASIPFLVAVPIEDFEGKPLQSSPVANCTNSLKYIFSPEINPVARIKPGEAVSRKARIDIGWGSRIDDSLFPGKYTVRAVCSYLRLPDGQLREVESAPIVVNLTDDDIREWRNLRTIQKVLRGDLASFEETAQFFNNTCRLFYAMLPAMPFRR